MDILDRYRGAVLGLATGDALGTTLEFSKPGTFDIGRCRKNHEITIRVAGALALVPHTSPTMTRAIFSPPTDDGSIGLA